MATPIKVDSVTSSVALATVANGFIIENTDANRLYVLLDSGTASATNFSFSLAQNEKAGPLLYNGPVKGIWASDGDGAALITVL